MTSCADIMKYYKNGGILYGSIYTIWRGFGYLKAIIATGFYKRVLASCGKGTVFGGTVIVLYPRNILIGDNCFIGDKVALTSDTPPGKLEIANGTKLLSGGDIDFTGGLFIGERTLISSNVRIITHDHGYDPRSDPIRQTLIIDDGAWIGSGSIILPGVRNIGKNSIIGAGAVVTKPVPEMAIVAGNPARIIGHNDKLQMEAP